MSIITENQQVKAGMRYQAGSLDIYFEEDPSYVRSESVLVDLSAGSIGVIFQNAYHHIGELPKNMMSKDAEILAKARLYGMGEGGKAIALHAPIKIVRANAA